MLANIFANELYFLQITRADMLSQLYLNNMHLGSRPLFIPTSLHGCWFISSNPFYEHGLTLIPAWIINHTSGKVLGDILIHL